MLMEAQVEEKGLCHAGGSVIPMRRFLARRLENVSREEIELRIHEFGVAKHNGMFLRTREKSQLISILMRLVETRVIASGTKQWQ